MALHPQDLKNAYAKGDNIAVLLRSHNLHGLSAEEAIEVSYDLQAGSYIHGMENEQTRAHKTRYGRKIAETLASLGHPASLLEAGIGEATTLSFVLDALPSLPRAIHGFDLSWSRIACARKWLNARGWPDVFLSVARIGQIPYRENSFDIVFTSHALEPNRGQEETLLKELYRVASRHLVLLEPGYELAGEEARKRMDTHGYCRGLPEKARALGMKVIRHELLGEAANPLNPTALTIIEKNASAPPAMPALACPCFGDDLRPLDGCYYSEKSMRSYPVLHGIPCLRPEKAIIAARLLDNDF